MLGHLYFAIWWPQGDLCDVWVTSCSSGFNKASALDFPLTILTTPPHDTWCCPGSTKCQGSPAVAKSEPYETLQSPTIFGLSVKFVPVISLPSTLLSSILPSHPLPLKHFYPLSTTGDHSEV